MKVTAYFFAVSMALGLSATCQAGSSVCSAEEAASVEGAIQQVETWQQFATYYAAHKKCDVDALRYAFTQQIAQLTASDQGLSGLSKMLSTNPRLKSPIFRHLKSESITSDDREQILERLETCKPRQKSLCLALGRALSEE
jgi:hypothetical protein